MYIDYVYRTSTFNVDSSTIILLIKDVYSTCFNKQNSKFYIDVFIISGYVFIYKVYFFYFQIFTRDDKSQKIHGRKKQYYEYISNYH